MFKRKILDYLVGWKGKVSRKPLILRGARQVGKTSAVLIFAKEHFSELIHLNLEKPEHLKLFREELSLEEFEKILLIKFKKRIIPGKTLLFIDEIQNSPALINLLRFFYEEKPSCHVIGAGSLLEAKVERGGFSLPVGRIEFAWLYPLDFFEYLEARGENEALRYLKEVTFRKKIPNSLHRTFLNLFYEYVMIGGMPEIVRAFIQRRDIGELKNIYSSLFISYLEDTYKYSSSAKAKYLNYVIEQAPLHAGGTITYEKFGGSSFRSREMTDAFELLEKVMLLYQVRGTKSRGLPLTPQRKKAPKLIFLDSGFVNYQMGIQEEFLKVRDLNDFYRGRIAEQIVGQNLLSRSADSPPKIFYWYGDKPQSTAEVDFCLNSAGKMLGVEVKSGAAGKLKSLAKFAEETGVKRVVRVWGGELAVEEIKFRNGGCALVSLPFYLLPRILEFGKE